MLLACVRVCVCLCVWAGGRASGETFWRACWASKCRYLRWHRGRAASADSRARCVLQLDDERKHGSLALFINMRRAESLTCARNRKAMGGQDKSSRVRVCLSGACLTRSSLVVTCFSTPSPTDAPSNLFTSISPHLSFVFFLSLYFCSVKCHQLFCFAAILILLHPAARATIQQHSTVSQQQQQQTTRSYSCCNS